MLMRMAEFGCGACFQSPTPEAAWETRRKFTKLAELVVETHFDILLMACPACGQACVSVFTERIDWAGGEDPQEWQVLPLTAAEVEALRADPTESRVESFGAGRPMLRRDFPSGEGAKSGWTTGPIRIGPHD